jgi:membrane-associated protein
VTSLSSLAVDSPLSYLVAVLVPALDALIFALPSESAVIALGVATAGSTDPRIGVLVGLAALGAFLGDNAAYLLGRRFGPVIANRVFGGDRGPARRAAVLRSLDRFGARLIVGCRFVPGGRTAVTVTCGLVGYPRRRFAWATACAGIGWAGYAFAIGRLGGKAFESRPWAALVLALGIALAVSVLIEVARRAWRWRGPPRLRPDRVLAAGQHAPASNAPAGRIPMTTAQPGPGACLAAAPLPAAILASAVTLTASAAGPEPGPATGGMLPGGLATPHWRRVLEARWQQRLGALTRLSLAYHDAADRLAGTHAGSDGAGARQLRRLLQQAVAARRALSDTEDALTRLSAGQYGRCEHCAAAIALARLRAEPEARYCSRCAGPAGDDSAAAPRGRGRGQAVPVSGGASP